MGVVFGGVFLFCFCINGSLILDMIDYNYYILDDSLILLEYFFFIKNLTHSPVFD